MAAKVEGPIQGVAREGFDAPYERQRKALRKELESTLAGPKARQSVPADDTELKNPHDELARPGTMTPGRD